MLIYKQGGDKMMEIKRINEKIVVDHLGVSIPALPFEKWKEFNELKKKYSLVSFLKPGKLTVVFDRHCEKISQIIDEYAEITGIIIPDWAKIN